MSDYLIESSKRFANLVGKDLEKIDPFYMKRVRSMWKQWGEEDSEKVMGWMVMNWRGSYGHLPTEKEWWDARWAACPHVKKKTEDDYKEQTQEEKNQAAAMAHALFEKFAPVATVEKERSKAMVNDKRTAMNKGMVWSVDKKSFVDPKLLDDTEQYRAFHDQREKLGLPPLMIHTGICLDDPEHSDPYLQVAKMHENGIEATKNG